MDHLRAMTYDLAVGALAPGALALQQIKAV
jgi:hypothetical protein